MILNDLNHSIVLDRSSMSHAAHGSAHWDRLLRLYARGKHFFKRGEQPQKNSDAGKKLTAINSCPAHKTIRGQRTLFSTSVKCQCGYHAKEVSMVFNFGSLYIIFTQSCQLTEF